MHVSKHGDWLKIEGEGSDGEPSKTAVNTGTKSCIDFMETGVMAKQSQLGPSNPLPCVMVHFANGRQIGLKTDDPSALLDDMLKLLRGEKK